LEKNAGYYKVSKLIKEKEMYNKKEDMTRCRLQIGSVGFSEIEYVSFNLSRLKRSAKKNC